MMFPDTERTRKTEAFMADWRTQNPGYTTAQYNRKFEEVYDRIGKELGGEGVIYPDTTERDYLIRKEHDREAELDRLQAEFLSDQGSKRKRRRRKPTPGAFGGRRKR